MSDPDFKRRTLADIRSAESAIPRTSRRAVFLASPASALITGTNLLVDGGWSVADMRSQL